ncbi:MAG: prolipoprotein diacylglyceryl transferase [Chloroflexi bacterium]|nr:prolipoprotein diacylglyceryl transferase [Chloroflexota bacterium]
MTGFQFGLEPVLLRAGVVVLRPSAILLVAGLAVGALLALRQSRALGLSTRESLDLLSWCALGALLGARLLDVLEHLEWYGTHPMALLDPASGMTAWGAALTGSAVLLVLARRRHLPAGRLLDAAAIAFVAGEALGQIGQALSGQGQGRVADLPWAVAYVRPDSLSPDLGVPRHPAQLYQALADLVILAALLPLRDAPPGSRFWLWLMLYGLSRAAIGVVRLDAPLVFELSVGQLLGLLGACSGGFAMILASARRRAPRAAGT